MPDFGIDFATPNGDVTWDLRPVTGRPLLVEALKRRFSTIQGTYPPDSGYGYCLALLLLDNVPSVSQIKNRIEIECLKDERVRSAVARVSWNDQTRNLAIELTVTDADGPFTFTLAVSDLTVELLRDEIDTSLGL